MADSNEARLVQMYALMREIAANFRRPSLPMLLTQKEAARELGLKSVSQFKARYVATRRIIVLKDPDGRPRVPSFEVQRLVDEMMKEATQQMHGSPPTPPKKTRSHGARPVDVEADVARFRALRKKRRD